MKSSELLRAHALNLLNAIHDDSDNGHDQVLAVERALREAEQRGEQRGRAVEHSCHACGGSPQLAGDECGNFMCAPCWAKRERLAEQRGRETERAEIAAELRLYFDRRDTNNYETYCSDCGESVKKGRCDEECIIERIRARSERGDGGR